MHAEMLIGSKFAKGKGEAEPVINPKTGAKIVALGRRRRSRSTGGRGGGRPSTAGRAPVRRSALP